MRNTGIRPRKINRRVIQRLVKQMNINQKLELVFYLLEDRPRELALRRIKTNYRKRRK